MGIIVQKYGGTSVGDVEKIRGVARKILGYHRKKYQVVVVVSAMAGETDRLIDLAHQCSAEPNTRELDLLLSSGERVSAALLSMAVRELGVESVSLTGRQVGIVTDSVHSRARIKKVAAKKIKSILDSGKIPIIAGFQGITETGDVTTLGRGGTDLSAVTIAYALKAEECLIFKDDVDGVYTTDPSVVPDARKLKTISYEEMLEMAGLGAKVLHCRAVEIAAKHNIPLRVIPTFGNSKGSLIKEKDDNMERELISGVIGDKNQAKITITDVPDRPGIAAEIFEKVAEVNLNVDMIIQNVGELRKTDISFTVPKSDAKLALKIAENISKLINAEDVMLDAGIAKVSIVGVGMRSHSGVASKMFKALSDKKINIMMISTSEIKISCVINEKQLKLAAQVLHSTFNLGKKSKK